MYSVKDVAGRGEGRRGEERRRPRIVMFIESY
jgi:hypothetical protein